MSFNSLKSLEGLSLFKHLESLVLDNNKLTMIGGGFDDYSRPVRMINARLKVLSLNNNRITNLDSFLKHVSICFPNLTYLSLMRNPCCPDDLSARWNIFYPWPGRDYYSEFRVKCRTALPRLQFLDSTNLRKSDLVQTKSFERLLVENLIKFKNGLVDVFLEEEYNEATATPLPSNLHRNPGDHHGTYYRNRKQYIGKQSEGNRFIGNGQL